MSCTERLARQNGGRPPSWWWRGMATVLVMVTAALTAYYTTVQGIRLSVNEKADRLSVQGIDNRLVAIETILRSDMVHRQDLAALQASVDSRLIRIETMLERDHNSP